MKIDPDRLRSLRKKQKLSLVKLAEKTRRVNPPGITEKTIQRLESTSQQNTTVREHTIESLVKALNVAVGVLTGELPLPESDKTSADNSDRVQIGAQIAPKTRLAYDLIKRRYGVNATEIINMAPLFFTLLAENSLAQRREKLKEAKEAVKRLHQIHSETAHRMFGVIADYGDEAYALEDDSIAKADLFGSDLFVDHGYTINVLVDEPFDPGEDNPFAHYLRKLADELDILGVVDVDSGVLSLASNFKFPHYHICRDELDRIANGSPDAKKALEIGFARLSEIPDELMAEDAREKRAKWLEEKLPDILEKDKGDVIANLISTSPCGDVERNILFKADSQKTNSETEKGENDE